MDTHEQAPPSVEATPAPPRRRSGRPDKPIPRSELIRVARELFAASGYSGVSMADIAHRAGLQKSSLFHHFPTKDQLYREVLDGVLVEVTDVLRGAMRQEGLTDVEKLDTATAVICHSLGSDSSRARLIQRELLNETGASAHVEAVLDAMRMMERFFEEGVSHGSWPKQDFRQLTLSLAGIHLFYYSVLRVTTEMMSADDPFAPAGVDQRGEAVQQHIHRLLGIA